MTVTEFKRDHPALAHLEGDALWDAMEDSVLFRGSRGVRRYRLRYLFYRKTRGFSFGKYSTTRCKHCKNGDGWRMMFMGPEGVMCSCGKPFVTEPNTNLDYRLYKIGRWWISLFWKFLEIIHLIKSSPFGRYDMFGDECTYVDHWTTKSDYSTPMKAVLKKRKWWEYIIIVK